MMNRTITALLAGIVASVMLLSALPAAAQANMAVVDPQFLVQNSEVGKSIRTQMDKLRANEERALKATQDNLTKLEQSLTQERATLAADEYQKRALEIRQKAAELQRDAQERGNKLEVAFRNAGVKVENVMAQIVDEINKERNFTMTFRRFALMGTTSVPDITQDVLKRLNQRMPSVVVELPK
ncbi:MAG TPA: OmpH family outer membrane protein [Alphaproteobacteria bacterium]|nr:OmpH family outer membrane protein [Alphaproteobacteria bacterium]